MVETLRAEIATAEAALDAERAAAARVRKSATGRESELEAQLSEAATELAAAQRAADSRAAALAAAEDRAGTAEREHEELTSELAAARERLRRCTSSLFSGVSKLAAQFLGICIVQCWPQTDYVPSLSPHLCASCQRSLSYAIWLLQKLTLAALGFWPQGASEGGAARFRR